MADSGKSMSMPPWPTARPSRDTLVTQFGSERADLIGWALNTGDPLADPVARRIAEGDRDLAADLDRGLHHGLAALERPDPDLAPLLEDLEQAAAGVDDDLLADGAEGFWTMPPAVHVISLSVGSLIRTALRACHGKVARWARTACSCFCRCQP